MAETTTRTAAPAPAPRKRGRGQPRGIKWAPYLFILPNMALFGLFTIWPAVNGFNIALYESSDGRRFKWVGLGNYERILTSSEFWQVATNTVIFAAAYVVLSIVLGVGIAILLDHQKFARGFFRGVVFVPVLISPIVVGLLWNWILDRRNGLVNQLLGGAGIPWLVDKNLVMVSVVAVGVWMYVGFYILILLAGLQGIDPNLYEAANLDGASSMQQLRFMTIPLLKPSILVVVILGTINGFQAFDFIYTLTGGGPVGASTLIVQYIYENAFVSPIRYGFASAAGVILFAGIFVLTLISWFTGGRKEADQ